MDLQHGDVGGALRIFVAKEMLEGEEVGLDASAPLLELGVIDSMSITLLTRFVQEHFQTEIPAKDLTLQNLASLGSIARLAEAHFASRKGSPRHGARR